MSKGQRGNKEAKKPKKVQPAAKPGSPSDTLAPTSNVIPERLKHKQ